MSLRVLLADESDTIKKVFQLALQDFHAEVKGVHSGLDVVDVALAFKPEIIFADVLLQKKNGYDTCLELKQHPKLKDIPVVLMWSSFMELDQAQFKRSLANDQLEKPFDADFLRNLVKKYAPVLEENPMAQFLNFPKSITAPLKTKGKDEAPLAPFEAKPNPLENFTLPEVTNNEDASEFNQSVIAERNTFVPTPQGLPPLAHKPEAPTKSLFDDLKFDLPGTPAPPNDAPLPHFPEPNEAPNFGAISSGTTSANPTESWQTTDLSKFQLGNESENLDKFEGLNLNIATEAYEADEKTDDFSQVAVANINEIINFDDELNRINKASDLTPEPEAETDATPATSTATSTATSVAPMAQRVAASMNAGAVSPGAGISGSIDPHEIEAIVRAHTEEFIKTEIKQTLMDTIEKIVREELNKILEEEVNLKQELSSDQP